MNKILLKELYLIYPVENLFHQLTRDLVVKIDKDKYPNWVYYFNNDNNCIFEYNTKNGDFWCNYKKYWTIFYEKFGFNYNQIKYLTKDMVENHFKLKRITPLYQQFDENGLGRKPFQIEGNYTRINDIKTSDINKNLF